MGSTLVHLQMVSVDSERLRQSTCIGKITEGTTGQWPDFVHVKNPQPGKGSTDCNMAAVHCMEPMHATRKQHAARHQRMSRNGSHMMPTAGTTPMGVAAAQHLLVLRLRTGTAPSGG